MSFCKKQAKCPKCKNWCQFHGGCVNLTCPDYKDVPCDCDAVATTQHDRSKDE